MNESIQRSDKWYARRVGKVTGSRVADAIARNRAGTAWLKARGDYMADLVAERLSEIPNRSYKSAAMRWGEDHEDAAAEAYEFRTGSELSLADFYDHPRIAFAGATPDRLVGDIGLVEIKCPDTATHIDTLESGDIPEEYLPQIRWQLACLPERAWLDFVSYDPRMPAWAALFIKRIHRPEDEIAKMEVMVSDFLDEVGKKVTYLRKQYQPAIVNIMGAG